MKQVTFLLNDVVKITLYSKEFSLEWEWKPYKKGWFFGHKQGYYFKGEYGEIYCGEIPPDNHYREMELVYQSPHLVLELKNGHEIKQWFSTKQKMLDYVDVIKTTTKNKWLDVKLV